MTIEFKDEQNCKRPSSSKHIECFQMQVGDVKYLQDKQTNKKYLQTTLPKDKNNKSKDLYVDKVLVDKLTSFIKKICKLNVSEWTILVEYLSVWDYVKEFGVQVGKLDKKSDNNEIYLKLITCSQDDLADVVMVALQTSVQDIARKLINTTANKMNMALVLRGSAHTFDGFLTTISVACFALSGQGFDNIRRSFYKHAKTKKIILCKIEEGLGKVVSQIAESKDKTPLQVIKESTDITEKVKIDIFISRVAAYSHNVAQCIKDIYGNKKQLVGVLQEDFDGFIIVFSLLVGDCLKRNNLENLIKTNTVISKRKYQTIVNHNAIKNSISTVLARLRCVRSINLIHGKEGLFVGSQQIFFTGCQESVEKFCKKLTLGTARELNHFLSEDKYQPIINHGNKKLYAANLFIGLCILSAVAAFGYLLFPFLGKILFTNIAATEITKILATSIWQDVVVGLALLGSLALGLITRSNHEFNKLGFLKVKRNPYSICGNVNLMKDRLMTLINSAPDDQKN